MSAALQRAREELGAAGIAAAVLLAGAALFLFLVLKPLEARNEALLERLSVAELSGPAGGAGRAAPAAARLSAFYGHFDTGESTTDWLTRLHAVGAAAGVELRAADYRLHRSSPGIQRYEMVLPLSGSYPQIRAFLRLALAEIPVLSLDQLHIRRERPQSGPVQAEARMTLHLVRP